MYLDYLLIYYSQRNDHYLQHKSLAIIIPAASVRVQYRYSYRYGHSQYDEYKNY